MVTLLIFSIVILHYVQVRLALFDYRMFTYIIALLDKEDLSGIFTPIVFWPLLRNPLSVLTESELGDDRGFIDVGWLLFDPRLLSVHSVSFPASLVGVPSLLLLLGVNHVHSLHERRQTVLLPELFPHGVLGAVEVPIVDSFRLDMILWVLFTLNPVELSTLLNHEVLHNVDLLAPFTGRVKRL